MTARWDPLKNEWLKRVRGASFEELLRARLVAIEEHPKKPRQKLMLIDLDGYIWCVPYVRNGDDVFLKTAFPSRAYTKKWMRGELR